MFRIVASVVFVVIIAALYVVGNWDTVAPRSSAAPQIQQPNNDVFKNMKM